MAFLCSLRAGGEYLGVKRNKMQFNIFFLKKKKTKYMLIFCFPFFSSREQGREQISANSQFSHGNVDLRDPVSA